MEQLVRAAQPGDPAATDALVRALAPYLGRVCGAIALDWGNDAMQETFIAVPRDLARGTGFRLGLDVRLDVGFCLMRGTARLYLVTMAAVPEDGGARTRFLHLRPCRCRGSGYSVVSSNGL